VYEKDAVLSGPFHLKDFDLQGQAELFFLIFVFESLFSLTTSTFIG